MHYPRGENKGADQLRGYREADLRLYFRICKHPVFSRRGSFYHCTFVSHFKNPVNLGKNTIKQVAIVTSVGGELSKEKLAQDYGVAHVSKTSSRTKEKQRQLAFVSYLVVH